MPAILSRAEPSAAANASPDSAVNTTPTPDREAKRLSGLPALEWAKQFGFRLKTNARWMKKFLHGGK